MSHFLRSALLLMTLVAASTGVHAQSNKDQAMEKGKQAILLEDKEGKYDEAIALFAEAQKLDPADINYPYETAYAYGAKKEYGKAIEILKGLLRHKDVNPRVYQMLGNDYDESGMRDKAVTTYEDGLKTFPKSGELYLELGNIQSMKKEYNNALGYYEKGIQVAPAYPSNYYHAAELFLSSSEEVWGMLYGEIFMNLERNSERTERMSKMLYDTYKEQIKFTSDTSYSVSFSKTATIDAGSLKKGNKFLLPFGTGVYEIELMLGILGDTTIDINSLNRIRTRFLEAYYKDGKDKDYPNLLFAYQKRIKDAGHFDAYNHWILMKGDEDGFEKWKAGNQQKWTSFVTWFGNNQLQTDATNHFYRAQYN